MGWDGIDFGYGVATTLKIVLWATAFPSQAFHPLGQQGYSREKSSPQPKPEQPVQYNSIKVGKRKPELTGREGTDDPELRRRKKGISGFVQQLMTQTWYSGRYCSCAVAPNHQLLALPLTACMGNQMELLHTTG